MPGTNTKLQAFVKKNITVCYKPHNVVANYKLLHKINSCLSLLRIYNLVLICKKNSQKLTKMVIILQLMVLTKE